jgi:DsbC/DsbD-like thiol-disulfide interchange protein
MQTEPPKADQPKRKRRWFQFSLRTLLVCVGSILLSACDRGGGETRYHQNAPADRRDPVVAAVETRPELSKTKSLFPVTASFRVEKTEVCRGEEFNVVVDMRITAGWHIYAMDRPAGASAATRIQLELPEGFESTGKWTSPDPMLVTPLTEHPVFVYDGNAEFKSAVRVLQNAALARRTLRCTIVYQACNQFTCQPPEEIALTSEVQVVP